MTITIKDIAKKTNYSTKTVSRVLNNDPMVSDKTRKLILDTIKKLGYRPNIIARSLRQQKTSTIGFIMPDILNPAYPMLFKGAADVLEKNGYYTFVSNTDDNASKEVEFIDDFDSMLIAGLVIIPSSRGKNADIFNDIIIPTVILDREIAGVNKDLVTADNKNGAYEATKLLIGNGHREIFMLSGPVHTVAIQKRVDGWKKAMVEHGLYEEDHLVVNEDSFSIRTGYEMMKMILEKKQNIDAIFSCNDTIAIGIMQAIDEAAKSIPEDISLVGFDDSYISQFLKPPLTTVRQPFYEEGKIAAEILLDRINNRSAEKLKRIILKTKLIIRETVAERAKVK
jgi:LacI family transcriptional regulator